MTAGSLHSLLIHSSLNGTSCWYCVTQLQAKLINILLCCQGERSGPSKEAVPSDKQAKEDKVEEGHVKDSDKQTETAPWAS